VTEEGPHSAPATLAGEILAGLSVALVLAPQAMAYAVLAGMPPWHGLYAAAVAPIAAAPFASSRYLQTGPVALTGLLTIGALGSMAATGTTAYVGLAALLALVVGVVRIAIGAFRLGRVAGLMTDPVLRGFLVGAALLIVASQVPSAFGVTVEGRLMAGAIEALRAPGSWMPGAAGLALVTVLLVRLGRKLHPLFPGVLAAAALGMIAVALGAPVGPTVGELPATLLSLKLDLPWGSLPSLILPGVVIALVGFAEAAAISRACAVADGEACVELLYVEPATIGCGVGRVLWQDLCLRAALAKATTVRIEADPHAVGFYERMGPVRIGDCPSGSIPGRMLPLLRASVSP